MLNFFHIFAKAFFGTILAMIKGSLELLPAVLEIKNYFSYMTPKGLVALYFGVPVFVVSVIMCIISKGLKKRV